MARTLAIVVVGVLGAALVGGCPAVEAADKGNGGARSNLASGDIALLENAFGNASTKAGRTHKHTGVPVAQTAKAQKASEPRSEIGMTYAQNTRGAKIGGKLKGNGPTSRARFLAEKVKYFNTLKAMPRGY